MYRTDKQFMKNPATAPSRIYVGGLPKTIVADDLEMKFSKHGTVLGLVINQGFAFIQFEHEHEAQAAIKSENNTILMSRKIVVRQAFAPKGGKDGGPQSNQGQPPKNEMTRGPPMQQTLTNARRDPTPPPPQEQKLHFEPPPAVSDMQEEETDTGPSIRPPPQKFDDDRRDDRGRKGGRGGNRGGRGGGGRNKSRERFEPPPRDIYPPEREGSSFYGRRGGDFGDNYGPPPPEVLPPPERNDCEIIVVSRALTEYAEYVESKLKHLGLIVDLLFPNENVPIGRVLANISSRGCLYAILIMPQNEEHRSLTLNILHGIPQEHRNMPIDDALLLAARNFEAYMRGETLVPEDPNRMNLADRHPMPIQMIFNLLAENRMLTSAQYERIIKYLQDRRDLQREHEVAEGITQDSNEPNNKQNELQNRILNILNKGNEVPIPTSITAPDPVPKEAPTPLLKDPSVQKALDSILSGDMFKGITGAL